MEYVKADGTYGLYPHSFDHSDLDSLIEFIGNRPTIHMVDSIGALSDTYPVVIRHDVDHSIEHAWRFANWERSQGIKSTYFILTSAPYYIQDRERSDELVRWIGDAGHEIGYHHNALAEGNGDVDSASVIFQEGLYCLTEAGAEIYGCAAHGGSATINNLDFWNSKTPGDFGLMYEAYHVHQGTNYISDNRGTWRAPLAHVPNKQAQLLIHPCHWELPEWA